MKASDEMRKIPSSFRPAHLEARIGRQGKEHGRDGDYIKPSTFEEIKDRRSPERSFVANTEQKEG